MTVGISRRSSASAVHGTWSVFLVLCLLVLSIASVAEAQAPIRKTVLIINEVGLSHPATALVTEEVMSRLAADPRYQTEFYVESLDSTEFTDEGSRKENETGLVREYEERKIDAIVAMGPESIRLLSQVSGTFLPGVPIVFCASTQVQAGDPQLTSRFTGSWMNFDVAKTLDAVIRLSPESRHVVVVSGTSQFDKATLAMTRASLDAHPMPLDFTYLTDLDMSSLLQQLRNLPKGSVVLYLSFFMDANGSQFVNATTALPLVSKNSSAPVFGISDTYVGRGIVGGYVVSFAEQGRIAAGLVSEVFEGKSPAEIPIVTGPSIYMFDARQLKRWGLSENRLPIGSIVLNREPTVWEKAKWVLLSGLAIILALTSLVGYLVHEQKLLNTARKEQMRLSGMLIKAQEDERARLASELHDDFSQRLAVLSLGLETAAEIVPESPEEANRQLHELMNCASELGADLHTLSHHLHSSTLERLGLAAGVAAFCKEFTAQQGIQVAFSHEDVPRSVSPEVALCLFRIVQEALRNVKKHSGGENARVHLQRVDGGLHLSISDEGNGFDMKNVLDGRGLGLLSMQERVRLVDGRFEIHSEPQKGTRIEVWAPLKKKVDTTRNEPEDELVGRTPIASGQSAD